MDVKEKATKAAPNTNGGKDSKKISNGENKSFVFF